MSEQPPIPDVDYMDFEPFEDEEDDPERDEMVLDCGLEGCLMPGYHMRSECHTVEMIEAQEREMSESNSGGSRHD